MDVVKLPHTKEATGAANIALKKITGIAPGFVFLLHTKGVTVAWNIVRKEVTGIV